MSLARPSKRLFGPSRSRTVVLFIVVMSLQVEQHISMGIHILIDPIQYLVIALA